MRKMDKKSLGIIVVISAIIVGLSFVALPALADTPPEKDRFKQTDLSNLKEKIGEDKVEELKEFMNSKEFYNMHDDFDSMNEAHDFMHGEDGFMDEELFDAMHGDYETMNEFHNNMHGYQSSDGKNSPTGMMGY